MPEKAERALREEANKHKGWSKERKNAYIYGALRHMGWKPGQGHAAKEMGKKK